MIGGLAPAERRALEAIVEEGDLIEVDGARFILAPVDDATLDILAAVSTEREDAEPDIEDESGCDDEPDHDGEQGEPDEDDGTGEPSAIVRRPVHDRPPPVAAIEELTGWRRVR